MLNKFVTLAETKAYIRNNEVENYKRKIKQRAETTTSKKGKTTYYAVANDRESEIRKYY